MPFREQGVGRRQRVVPATRQVLHVHHVAHCHGVTSSRPSRAGNRWLRDFRTATKPDARLAPAPALLSLQNAACNPPQQLERSDNAGPRATDQGPMLYAQQEIA